MPKFTRLAIMNTFMKLLAEQPFDKITVKDIVEECGINRNTFYYYFRDIYGLVDEIMQYEINRILEKHKTPYPSWNEGLLEAVEFAIQNKKAIVHLHNSVKRPQVVEYLQKTIYGVVSEFVERKAQGMAIAEKDLNFVSAFYTFALLGMLETWIDEGMKDDVHEVIRKTGILFDVNVGHALEAVVAEYQKRNEEKPDKSANLPKF